jgi:cytoskeletal protein RodZ
MKKQHASKTEDASPNRLPANDQTIGMQLHTFRQNRQQTLKDIAENLRISERFLGAIESMDTSQLPERVYTLGFVRSYAHYLEIDPQKAVNQFKQEVYGDSPLPTLSLPQPAVDLSKVSWRILFLSLGIVIALLISGYVFIYKKYIRQKPRDALAIEMPVDKVSLKPEAPPKVEPPVKTFLSLPDQATMPKDMQDVRIPPLPPKIEMELKQEGGVHSQDAASELFPVLEGGD